MITLSKITIFLLYLMLLSPILSYFTLYVFDFRSIHLFFYLLFTIYGFVFILINSHHIRIPKYAYFALLWAIYLLVWSMFNGVMERRGLLLQLFVNVSLSIFFIIVIIQNTQFTPKVIRNFVNILKVTVIISALVSVVQVFSSDFLNAWPVWTDDPDLPLLEYDIYTQRRTSIFGYIDPNALGLSFIPILSILIGYSIYSKTGSIFMIILAGALVAALSNTRYVMVGFLIVTLQIILFYRFRIWGFLKYSVIITLITLMSYQLITFFGYDIEQWMRQRLFAEEAIQETTRYLAVVTFLEFFPQFMIFGNGAIMDEEVVSAAMAVGSSHIHIGYLSHLVAFGIVGCFFLFTFWFLLLRKLYRTAKRTKYWGSFFAFLFFLFSFATMSQSSIFFYGLIFALVFDKYFSDKCNMECQSQAQLVSHH